MIYYVQTLHWLVIVNILFMIVEFFMVFMHYNEALPTNVYNKIVICRRGLSILLFGFCALCVWGIYSWKGHHSIHILVENKCTQDVIL
jgi:hypothetical protein